MHHSFACPDLSRHQTVKGSVLELWGSGLASLPKIIGYLLGDPDIRTAAVLDSGPSFAA
jgi:hypothetical protein